MPFELRNVKRIDAAGMGALQFFEASKDVPFEIKRIYYITDVPQGIARGGHAHKRLQQFLFCPYGKILIKLDDGNQKSEIVLDKSNFGILLTPCIWRDMFWLENNSVLCVAVSDYYEADDYIRNYDEFQNYVNSVKNDNTGRRPSI